jgi:hypothetical protein
MIWRLIKPCSLRGASCQAKQNYLCLRTAMLPCHVLLLLALVAGWLGPSLAQYGGGDYQSSYNPPYNYGNNRWNPQSQLSSSPYYPQSLGTSSSYDPRDRILERIARAIRLFLNYRRRNPWDVQSLQDAYTVFQPLMQYYLQITSQGSGYNGYGFGGGSNNGYGGGSGSLYPRGNSGQFGLWRLRQLIQDDEQQFRWQLMQSLLQNRPQSAPQPYPSSYDGSSQYGGYSGSAGPYASYNGINYNVNNYNPSSTGSSSNYHNGNNPPYLSGGQNSNGAFNSYGEGYNSGYGSNNYSPGYGNNDSGGGSGNYLNAGYPGGGSYSYQSAYPSSPNPASSLDALLRRLLGMYQ